MKRDRVKDLSNISWQEEELKCKTKLLLLPKKEFPIITILILIKAGSSLDPRGKEGLARLVFKTMITGTEKMDWKTLSFEIERIGASLDVFTSKDFTIFSMELLSINFLKGIKILSDILLNPAFKEEEIEKEKEKTLNIIKDEKNDPALTATKNFFEVIFKNTPYSHPSIGYLNSVKRINKEDILNFYNEMVNPENSFIVIVGNFDDNLIKVIDEHLSPWKTHKSKSLELKFEFSKTPEFFVINDPDSTQAQIRMGKFSSLRRGDEDFIPAIVGNAILGNLFTSRLINKIRGELGLSYAINSSIHSFKYGGIFSISTFTKNESVFKIIDSVRKEVEEFVEKGIREDELERVKRFINGKFPSALQTYSDLAGRIAEIEYYELPKTYLKDYLERIENLKIKEVEDAIRKHLSPDGFSILVLGKIEEIEKNLSLIGKFNVKEV